MEKDTELPKTNETELPTIENSVRLPSSYRYFDASFPPSKSNSFSPQFPFYSPKLSSPFPENHHQSSHHQTVFLWKKFK